MTSPEQPEAGASPRQGWRARFRSLPPKVWGLVIAPVIPVIVAAVVTTWLDGSHKGSPPAPSAASASASAQPSLAITGAERREDASLGAFLAESPEARGRHGKLLGCEGAVFAVAVKIQGLSGGAPQLTWSLREKRGLHTRWEPPAAYDDLRRMPVKPVDGEKLVWVPFPGERDTWLPGFKLFRAAADIPADPADSWEGKAAVESIPLPPGDLTGPCELGAG